MELIFCLLLRFNLKHLSAGTQKTAFEVQQRNKARGYWVSRMFRSATRVKMLHFEVQQLRLCCASKPPTSPLSTAFVALMHFESPF
jgi:hypothetical protein